ncbi:MAG: hypothetical protein CMA31_01485 [Euryarchaeota archaeon]|nr:hypothetical protein [Euryarchaeota archaeon]
MLESSIYLSSFLKNFNIFLITLFLSPINLEAENWFRSSGNYEAHLYSPETQINEANINDLEKAFSFNTGHVIEALGIQSAPIFTGDKLIINAIENISALDPRNGDLIWQYDIGSINDMNNPWAYFTVNRGILFNETSSKLYRATNFGVLELDVNSGKLLNIFKDVNSSLAPIIFQNNLYVASVDQGVIAFDLTTKEKIWHTSFVRGGFPGRVWSGFSFDPKSKTLFAITGSSGGVKGIGRQDPNMQTSLIAIDAYTGEILWSFQHIDHDVWDLDLLGNPIIVDLEIKNEIIRSVIALSKTGDILLLDLATGKPVHDKSFKLVSVPESDIPGEKLAKYQKKFFKPQPFWKTEVDLVNDFSHLDAENKEYVENKIRYAKSGFFIPPSINYDTVLYGIHGGAEWFGGAIDFTSENPSLVVPYNRDPWIIRAYHTDKISILIDRFVKRYQRYFKKSNSEKIKAAWVPWDHAEIETLELSEKIYSYIPFTPKDKSYKSYCASCHGLSRRGFYEYEGEGDLLYPPLVGSTLGKKEDFVMNFNKVKSLHESVNIPYQITKEKHSEIFEYFDKYDKFLQRNNLLSSRGFWQVLLDKDRNPATKPPWGGLSKIDLVTGKVVWDIPFGKRRDDNNNVIADGDRVFGGIMNTASGLTFANGNPDGYIYAFNADGKKIWEDLLPFAGSAPPISYSFKGCQYVVFTSTGGRYYDFKQNGDLISTYKLDSCN